MRQGDIEPDGGCAGFKSPFIGSFHNAGPTARRNNIVAQFSLVVHGAAALRHDSTQLHCGAIPVAAFAFIGRFYACRPEGHDGRAYTPFAQMLFGLHVFQHEAYATRRVAKQELLVKRRQGK